jgi:hypothetical protein
MPRTRIRSETAFEATALLSSLIGELMEDAAGTAVRTPPRTADGLAERARTLNAAADNIAVLGAALAVAARLAARGG